jgi:IS5 family transposase
MEENEMDQTTFSDMEYSNRKRPTKREEFLDIMEEIIPWDEWVEFVRPYYPDGKRGRPTTGIERMLRMYLLQIWFNLSDEGVEDAIYDSYAFRKFMKINFINEQVPDSTTLLKFRHMIEKNHLGEEFFKAINRVMEETGHIMHGGTIVDATIINAPSSTKNTEKKRDPEMHQTKKDNEWRFGMKCHIGVDAGTGLVHSITATSANVHDITEAHKLIRKDDEVVYGDSGFLGIEKREEIRNDEHLANIEYRINRRPKSLPKVSDNAIDWERYIDYRKSAVRCKVEHAFKIIKDIFNFRKVRYRGIEKNFNKLNVLFACANLLMVKRGQKDFRPVMG